jgi:outer membrane lipoprotein-sorting protein
MNRRTGHTAFAGLCAAVLLAGAAPLWCEQALDGPAILAKVDEVMNAPKDQRMKATLILTDKAGGTRTRVLEMYQKGADRRLARFLSPADQKGIAVLSLPQGVIYLYLPAYKKVKRIASHVKNNAFAGTDFTYDDMEAKRYSEHYDARLVKEEGESWVLELVPKDPSETDNQRLVFRVLRDSFVPTVIEYYNKKNVITRRLACGGIGKVDGYWVAQEREMADLGSGHRSKMILNELKFDTGLSDDLFTTRYLEK